MVRFSTGLPNCREGRLNPIGSVDVGWMREVTAAAEELGYFSIWLNEFLQTEPNVAAQFDQPPSYYDPLTTIGYLVALTRRLRFVTSTIVLPHHHPLLLSRQVATLDVLSDGRITLGVGLGGSVDEFRQLRGDLDRPNRAQMMDEFLQGLRALWELRRASFHGTYVRFTDVETHPKPVQRPLPIFMAGTVEGVYRRISRFGQGWIDTSFSPEETRQAIAVINTFLAEAGRVGEKVEVARQFYVSLDSDPERAAENLEASLPGLGRRVVERQLAQGREVSLVGTPEQMAKRLREFVSAGVTEICPIFYSANADGALRQMELFARSVIPAVK
jgi:probable F420-dependent oxidoreductase